MNNTVLEYLEGYFGNELNESTSDEDIMENYTPFGHSDYQTIVSSIKGFASGKPTAVISTINGDSNVPFYKELAAQGILAEDIPVVAFSVGEEELRGIDTEPLVGHLTSTVWRCRCALTGLRMGGGRRLILSRWRAASPVGPGNIVLLLDKEAAKLATAGSPEGAGFDPGRIAVIDRTLAEVAAHWS